MTHKEISEAFEKLRGHMDGVHSVSDVQPILLGLKILECVVADLHRIADAMEKKK